ncbi:MAG TPA: enoyl-CoA hydratase-related protein [Puia sp.]|nr:enoyl-CoA hydratase-related protein [Puia sp.]
MYSTLLTDLTDHIFTITINRPDKLNAINKYVMNELDEVVQEIYENAEIKSAIITGAGAKAFVAGADISEFLGLSKEEGQALSKKGQDIFSRIESSAKPIVAAVNGFALGGGCELAMACHFRLCSENARFGQPEVNLGLIPGYGGTQRLTHLVGRSKALELMLTGAMIDAQAALQLGLVNYVTTPGELLLRTRELLALIGEKAPIAVAKIIACVNVAAGGPAGAGVADTGSWGVDIAAAGSRGPEGWLNGFVLEQEAFGECFATEDMKEGASAFLEKRKPHFSGK